MIYNIYIKKNKTILVDMDMQCLDDSLKYFFVSLIFVKCTYSIESTTIYL